MAPKGMEQKLQRMGEVFTSNADGIYYQLMDLNVPTIRIRPQLEQLLQMRENMIATAQGRATGKQPALAMGGGAGGQDLNWKQDLHQAISQANKTVVTKGEIVFTTLEVPSQSGGPAKFMSSVSYAGFQTEYTGEEAASKKMAEQNAAKAAVQSEFPQVFQSKAASPGGGLAVAVHGGPIKPGGGGGQKRGREEEHPKAKLLRGLTLLIGRSLTKDDVIYNVDAVETTGKPSVFTCTATLACYDNMVVQGQGCESRKAAEMSACEAAVAMLQGAFGPAEEEHKAKKAKKAAEEAKKRDEKRDAKRAEKVAAEAVTKKEK